MSVLKILRTTKSPLPIITNQVLFIIDFFNSKKNVKNYNLSFIIFLLMRKLQATFQH